MERAKTLRVCIREMRETINCIDNIYHKFLFIISIIEEQKDMQWNWEIINFKSDIKATCFWEKKKNLHQTNYEFYMNWWIYMLYEI